MSAYEGHGILLHHVGCTNAAARWPWIEVVVAPRKPMVGTLVDRCAFAASGHAAAPPRSAMKSRRLMGLPQGQGSRTKYSTSWIGSGPASQQKRATHVRFGATADSPIYLSKQTKRRHVGMSALCQKMG